MSQLVVTAIITTRPDAREEALAALTEGISSTHAEDGCVAYALHEDVTQPGRFVFVEKWASQDDLDGHMKSSHLQAMVGALGSLLAEAPTILTTTPLAVGDPAKSTI